MYCLSSAFSALFYIPTKHFLHMITASYWVKYKGEKRGEGNIKQTTFLQCMQLDTKANLYHNSMSWKRRRENLFF